MIILIKIFYGILLFIGGILVLKYRKNIYEWTGRFGWAEHYLGSGGTVVIITLVGLVMIFLSVTYPTGMFETTNEKSIDSLNVGK